MWLRKTQNLPTGCTSCRLNPHNHLGRLCIYGIYKRTLRASTKENVLVLITVDTGGKRHRSRTILESGLPPHRSRDHHSVGGHPREVRWTVTPSKGKDPDSSDSKTKTTTKNLFLFFDLLCKFFWILFFFFPPSIVVVDFIGTKKSN